MQLVLTCNRMPAARININLQLNNNNIQAWAGWDWWKYQAVWVMELTAIRAHQIRMPTSCLNKSWLRHLQSRTRSIMPQAIISMEHRIAIEPWTSKTIKTRILFFWSSNRLNNLVLRLAHTMELALPWVAVQLCFARLTILQH